MFGIRVQWLVSVWLLLSCVACAPGVKNVVGETDEKQYQLAQEYKNQGRMEEALRAFLRVIDARREAPESHLDAGYIYLRIMKEPTRAIYHFDRYLQFKPQSPQAPKVRRLIETAQKEFARQLPAQPYEGELDLIKNLKQENNRLKQELVAAKAQIRNLENQRTAASDSDSGPTTGSVELRESSGREPGFTQRPDPLTVPRVYRVQPSDTLSEISKRFYGTSSRWIDIYQANLDRLPSENALRIGQELRIP